MYPVLFEIGGFRIYAYGFSIMVGALLGYFYLVRESGKLGISSDRAAQIALCILVSSFAGGKFFLWLGDWEFYLNHPSEMLTSMGSGFVFYGSLIFSLITLLWFFRKNGIRPAPLFDILAVSGTCIHGFGKIGCFLSGCCHGKVCSDAWGVVYHAKGSAAEPLHVPLYPTQLIDAAIIFFCTAVLLWLKNKKRFDGQLMLVYLLIYGTGRFFTEFLRGDEGRGYLFNGLLSQSQVISLVLVPGALLCYWLLSAKGSATTHRK